jgi:hypothetical protein
MLIPSTNTTIYTKYPEEYKKKCISCRQKIKFLYPSRKRHYSDFDRSFSEVRYNYTFTNLLCSLFNQPFNPSPRFALPEKHFTLSIWKWIAREAKVYNSNASKIMERIENEFSFSISENTIRNIIDEIDVYLTQKIDENTQKILEKQKYIVLALDGQQPNEGEDALWLFVDVISNRVLKIEMLRSADHQTLYKIIEQILITYNVQLAGIVSDKQGSIVKMRDTYFSKIPHQYCQFHFLQKIWNHLEVKDSNLQKSLGGMVNHLYITTVSKTEKRKIPDIGEVNMREYFFDVENDLRKLLKNRVKKFENLRGTKTYEKLNEYLAILDSVWQSKDENHRVTKILKNTADSIREALEEYRVIYLDCNELLDKFQEIRKCLNKKQSDALIHSKLFAEIFNTIWKEVRNKESIHNYSDLRAIMPSFSMSKIGILQQWVRLHRSYSRGLFEFYKFPIIIFFRVSAL